MSTELAASVRKFLADTDKGRAYDTMALAYRLMGFESDRTARRLTRLAPHMPDVATHDGETVTRGGQSWTRWRWHGTRKAKAINWDMED